MLYEVAEDRAYPGMWRAEAVNHDGDGEVYVAIFSGPSARERAEEYAMWQNRRVEVVPTRKAS